ncbi:hypothetical protein [Photobacterium leiognathi]|uniref:hypothetical protein n=1 Tax=Photobacterium leiognathi TaxID=553611 RepID=UPI0006B639E3|nr:hypothetical protein [Photobacterium leiognathi]KPA53267.1 hypothetical protein VT25_08540 [Photobacterium leiognathi subsp. mandapamensis]
MNLEEFITISLSQIAKGIDRANDELKESQAFVSPSGVMSVSKDNKYGTIEVDNCYLKVTEIKFDVSLTVVESSESGGKLGVSMGGFSIGANGKENQGNTSASRIQFSIPMVLPQVSYVKPNV